MSHFYALMPDNTVKYISLRAEIVDDVQALFRRAYTILKPAGIEECRFDGNIVCRNGENITFVDYILPDDFHRIPNNQADMSEFIITEDSPKSIFVYDDGKYYFQIFNKKNLLKRKTILRIEQGNTFAKMNEEAFVIEDKIQAIYENGKLYFQSYTSANHIFSLMDFVTEATDEDIEVFGNNDGINVDINNIKDIANVKTRRLIKLLASSRNVDAFMSKKANTRKKLIKQYGIKAEFDEHDKLILPTNNVGDLNRVLEFFNEDIFEGVITNTLFRSNSKRKDTA